MEYQKTKQERQGLNQNCADLLFKTNREIKSLNYKLMRVVTTDDNFHTLLTPDRMNDIEVIEQTPIICKVPVKGMLSPLKLAITFKTSNLNESKPEKAMQKSLAGAAPVTLNADIKVYVSTTHKEPGESQYEKVYSNVKLLRLTLLQQTRIIFSSTDKGGRFLSSDFVYVTFLSHTGCPINVYVSFPQEISVKGVKRAQTAVGKIGEAGGIMIPQEDETGSAVKPMNDPKEIEAFLSSNPLP